MREVKTINSAIESEEDITSCVIVSIASSRLTLSGGHAIPRAVSRRREALT